MATKLRSILDTHRLNFRMTQWPITVLDPFEDVDAIVERAHQERTAIDADRRLTPEGKTTARLEKRTAAVNAVNDLYAKRLAGIDADVAAHRAALLPVSTTEKPDARRIDFLLSHLRDKTPQEIATFYDKASDDERLLMEAAAASVGRIPLKTPQGGLQWKPLLEPETVNESIMARATAKNPAGVKKLEELNVIREMHVTVHGNAVAEINDVMYR
jgi:hypothetical protein